MSLAPDPTERWVLVGELFLLCYLAQQASSPTVSRNLFLEKLGHHVVTPLWGQMSICKSQNLL